MTESAIYIGIDAGGTETKALVQVGRGGRPRLYSGPGANLQRLGAQQAARVLSDVINRVRQDHPGHTLDSVCAGVAGAGRIDDQVALRTVLHETLGDRAPLRLQIVHDAVVALEGAFEGGSGIIVIAGTGSIAFARTRTGALLRVGGWGYLLGDEGSGYALGLAGLRAVASTLDGGPTTHLRELLAERFGIASREELIRCVYRDEWPIQQMAPLVLEAAGAGDTVARRLVDEQAQALADQVALLATRARDVERRVALMGGVAGESYYRGVLLDALRARLPDWRFEPPAHPPVMGALRLALATTSS